MISTFDAAPFMRVQLMHGGPSTSGAGPKEVRVPVVEFPLDGEIRCPLDLWANVELLSSVYLLDHPLPAVGIPPGAELRDDAVAHRLVLLRVHEAQRFPPFTIDPYRWIVGGFLRICLGLCPVNHRETRP